VTELGELEALYRQGAYGELDERCRRAKLSGNSVAGIGAIHGRALKKLGRFEEALQVLRDETMRFPDAPEGFYLLGRQLIEQESREIDKGDVRGPYVFRLPWGNFGFPARPKYADPLIPVAIENLRRCIEIDPSRNDARALLGLTLFNTPETRMEGTNLIQHVVKQAPALADGHFGLARAAFWQGSLEFADAAFSHVLGLDANYPHAAELLALVRFGLKPGTEVPGEIADQSTDGHCLMAESLQIVLSNPAIPDPMRTAYGAFAQAYAKHLAEIAGDLARNSRAFTPAARLLAASTVLHSGSVEACRAYGEIMLASSALDLAETAFQKALEQDPADKAAMERLNLVSFHLGKEPPHPDVFDPPAVEEYLKLGNGYLSALNLVKAADTAESGLKVYPDNVELLLLLSWALAFRGFPAKAMVPAEKCFELAPDDHRIRNHMASILMSLGQLKKAWGLTESRFTEHRPNSREALPDLPRWKGEPLAGKGLLIWREEGFGDEIRYASCIPDAIRDLPCERIIYECEPRLQSLFARSFPQIEVRPEDLKAPCHEGADYHLPLLSLPGHFRNDVGDFPESGVFLVADDERVAKWKKRLESLGAGRKIGLSWRSFNQSWRKRPFSSVLKDLEPILRRDQYSFISLQGDDCADEIAAAERQFGCSIQVFEDLDIKNDAEEVAALLTALDAVVTCRCWITAFAGALGVPTYCFSAPFNMQMMDLPYDPWAPATTLFYRSYEEGWEKCMISIADALGQDLVSDDS